MRRAFSLPILLAGLALASCGGSSASKTAATTPSSQSAPSSSTAAPATTAATTAAAPTATAPSTVAETTSGLAGSRVGLCRAAVLHLSYLGQNGATGKAVIGFELRNAGPRPCHTFGYPGILFLTRSGAALPTLSTRTTHDFAGTVPLRKLNLPPGVAASFRLGVTHGINSSAGCATAYGVQVIPPDDTSALRVEIPGGVYFCRTVSITPVAAGTSAYP